MKKVKLLLFVFIFLVVGNAAKDIFLQSLLEKYLSQATGSRATVGKLRVSFFQPLFEAEEILLFRSDLPFERLWIRISQAYFDLDLLALFRGRYHIRRMGLIVEELFITNPLRKSEDFGEIKIAKETPLTVDLLELTVMRVIERNEGTSPVLVRDHDPRVRHERFHDIQGIGEIFRTVMSVWKNSPSS